MLDLGVFVAVRDLYSADSVGGRWNVNRANVAIRKAVTGEEWRVMSGARNRNSLTQSTLRTATEGIEEPRRRRPQAVVVGDGLATGVETGRFTVD